MAGTITLEEFNKLQQSLMEYKEKYYTSEEKVKNLNGKIQTLQKSTPSLGSGWFSAGNKQQTSELQRENENLMRSITQLKEEFNAQSSALKENIRSLYEENETLQEDIKRLQSETGNQKSSSELPPTSSESEQLIETLRKENQGLKQQCDQLQSQLQSQSLSESIQQPSTGSETENEHEKFKQLESSLEDAQNRLKESQQELEQSRSLYSALQQKFNESSQQFESQQTALQTELDSEKSQSKSLQSQLESSQSRFQSLQQQYDELSSKLMNNQETSNHESESESQSVSEDNDENAKSLAKIESLTNQIHALQLALQTAHSQSQAASEESQQFQKQILTLQQTIQEKETALKSNQNLLSESVAQLEASQNELNQMKSLQESLETQLSEQTQKSLLFQQNLDQLSRDLASKSDELAKANELASLAEESSKRYKIEASNAREELTLTQNDRSIIISKMTEKDLENDTLRDELQTARVRLDELLSVQERTPELEELISLKSDEARSLREQVEKLRQENSDWEKDKARFDTLQQESQQVRSALTQLTEKYSRVENELNHMSIRKEELVTKHREQTESLRNEHLESVRSLQERIDQHDSEMDHLRSQLDEATLQLAAKDSEISTLKASLHSTIEELEPLRTEFSKLQEDSHAMEKRLAELQEKLTEAEGKVSDLERDLNEARLKNGIDAKKFQRLIQDLQTQLQKARSEKSEKPKPPPSSPSVSLSQGTASSSNTNSTPMERAPSAGEIPRPSAATSAAARVRPVRVSSDQIAQPPPMIPQDIEALALRVGDLQKRNFALEEHIKKLRLRLRESQKEIENKSKVIQTHLANIQLEGRSTPQMDQNKVQRAVREGGIMGRIFGGNSRETGDPQLQAEINSKMARVLEDTLLKNVQLQADMETMGYEILRLEKENAEILSKFSTSTTTQEEQ